MADNDPEIKDVQGEFPDRDAKSWLEYSVKMQQEAPERFEEAAKFLATIISLSITIIFTSLHRLTMEGVTKVKLVLLLCGLVISLICAFFVMFPMRYKFSSISVDDIKKENQKSAEKKWAILMSAVSLYLLCIISLFWFYF